MIDSSDKDRIDEARESLMIVISDEEMRDCALLILANK